jgi:sugar fermentation stimulation protein A
MRLPPLVSATLIKRYKRFLADCRLDDGTEVTAHVANSGSLLGMTAPGTRIWISTSDDPARKLKHSWELVEAHGGLVNVNTSRPNRIAEEAIRDGGIPALVGYASLRGEVKYGKNSRIDLLLDDPVRGRCYVEVKSVTLSRQAGVAEFPDAVTARGAKHLDELIGEVKAGNRAVMLYLVQVPDAKTFTLARDIDPTYAEAFVHARANGVEAIAAIAHVTTEEMRVIGEVPVVAPDAA